VKIVNGRTRLAFILFKHMVESNASHPYSPHVMSLPALACIHVTVMPYTQIGVNVGFCSQKLASSKALYPAHFRQTFSLNPACRYFLIGLKCG
jgi:hypothetical protein